MRRLVSGTGRTLITVGILILAFVGVKLLLMALPPYLDEIGGWFRTTWGPFRPIKIDTLVSLVVVVTLLGGAVALSAMLPSRGRTRD